MALYLSPLKSNNSKTFNLTNYSIPNSSIANALINTNNVSTVSATVSKNVNVVAGTDTLSLEDTLLQQHNNDLNITTDDVYVLHLNNNKPISGDIMINENSTNSNVNIVNGSLNIQNGNLNLGQGTLILDGADVRATLVGNNYILSVHADTIANHSNTIGVHAQGIQSSIDTGTF
jgi:hypothetical protein